MRIQVDRAKCRGIGLCEMTAPTVFEVGDDGKSHVIKQPSDDEMRAVEAAVADCPTEALSIED